MGIYTGKLPANTNIKLSNGKTRTYLKRGDKGTKIKQIQRFLNWVYDISLVVDGNWGDETNKAVIRFQTEVFSKKEADGLFGSKTLEKAKSYEKTEPLVEEVQPEIITITYPGTLPTTILKKTNAQAIQDAVKWAKWIATDNSFHYGYTNKKVTPWKPNAHHNGCYFCNTNGSKKGMLDYKKTYCCNPFVGAAWAHGACDTKAKSLCSHGGSWDFGTGAGSYHKSDRFKKLGHPKMKNLKAGDVLCMDTHIALYVGGNQIAEAGSGDDNIRNSVKWNNSIRVRTLTASNYKKFKRVYRYIGSVNSTSYIKHGEVSERVKLWQGFLDWYYDGKVGAADGYFGDNTLKWTKKFQKEVGLNGTGSIGPKTLTQASKIKKEISNV